MSGTIEENKMSALALAENTAKDRSSGKEPLDLSWPEWKWPLYFMLCFSALGLKFPLAYLLIPVILINRFRNDRYDFTIMITLLCGEYGITCKNTFGVQIYFAFFCIAVLGLFIYRKSGITKKIVVAWCLYAAGLITFAMLSEERMAVQYTAIIRYLAIILFIIPLMIFSGDHSFDIRIFFRRLMPYCLIACIWYILDCVIIGGWIFIPNTQNPWADPNLFSKFYSPILTGVFSFPRKYPNGLYILAMAIYPVIKFYKLSKWQWALIFISLATTRTFSFIFALVATYLFFKGQGKKLLKYIVYCIIGFCCLYFIDGFLPYNTEVKQSTLRIKSTIDQIFILQEMEDDEDLSEFGTGRMAQILPKMELLYDLNRQWIGFGFLNPEKTTMTKYIIYNPFYTDQSKSEEVAAQVEVTVIQHILFNGYLGLIMVILFYGYICWTIRKQPYARYTYSLIMFFCIAGIGGFGGLVFTESLGFIALALSVVVLNAKQMEKAYCK